MRILPGFTLIEILLVIGISGIVIVPTIHYFGGIRENQILVKSSEEFADVLRQAHIYSREARDDRTWGVVNVSATEYQLVTYEDPTLPPVSVKKTFHLAGKTRFHTPYFNIIFEKGSGNIATDTSVQFITVTSIDKSVNISVTGVVTVE